MRRRNCRILLTWVLSLMVCAVVASGQQGGSGPPAPETAEDSARWWTLTDEITPQELRAIHADVELHKERYREDVRAGKRPLQPKKQMDLLNFYIDGNSHPELFQMWAVFRTFAAGFDQYGVDRRKLMTEFGFLTDVQETIAAISIDYLSKRKAIEAKYAEDSDDLLEFVRLSRETLGEKGYRIAGKAKDATRLAIATGYSVEKVEKYLKRIWGGERPIKDLTIQTLPLIKEALEPDDWELFRRYLLEVHAPDMSASGYAEVEED